MFVSSKHPNKRSKIDAKFNVNASSSLLNYKNIIKPSALLELMKSELCCAICHEILIHSSVLRCGHVFCAHCLDLWLERKFRCPLCAKRCHHYTTLKTLDNFIDQMFSTFLSLKNKIKRTKLIENRLEEENAWQVNKNKKGTKNNASLSTTDDSNLNTSESVANEISSSNSSLDTSNSSISNN